ncbi:hypothetical protein Tco_0690495 [Tanacetum coccineum]
MATPINFSTFMMNRLKIDYLTQELLTGPTYDLMKGSCKSVVELEYHLEEVFKATNDQLDWNNPEGMPYPHDLSKPLPLIPNTRGRLVIPFNHFINNDLEYLKGGSLSYKYTTSITKTKAADYGQIKWIKDMIPRIISLKNMKFYGYSHLEEITVRQQDDKLYKFQEGDFKRLRCQDIDDMLLIIVQERVEDLQLAVDMNKNRLICTDELHKFSDGILNHVRTALNDIAASIQMEYLPKRRWTNQDKRRARVMINAIDRKLRDRRLIRSLEKFVGGRPYGEDLRLLQRTM